VQLNEENTANGTTSFSSAATFLKNSANAATYAAQLPVNGLRKTELYSYVEDELWEITRSHTSAI
jgi:hypothetical protein